jgi:hypothetical protein
VSATRACGGAGQPAAGTVEIDGSGNVNVSLHDDAAAARLARSLGLRSHTIVTDNHGSTSTWAGLVDSDGITVRMTVEVRR